MRCLARLIRCAIVASGTRKAPAISAVVRPPTARSVSAIADERRQRRVAAHEQQDQRVVLVQRGRFVGGRRQLLIRWRLHHDDCLAAAARQLGADVIGHPPRRDVDQPAARVVRARLRPAIAAPRRSAPPAPRLRRRRSRRSGASRRRAPAARGRAAGARRRIGSSRWSHLGGGALITSRTSIGMLIGHPARPGAADARAAIS